MLTLLLAVPWYIAIWLAMALRATSQNTGSHDERRFCAQATELLAWPDSNWHADYRQLRAEFRLKWKHISILSP
jgi:hypothetical protein